MNDRELEARLRAQYRTRAGETETAPLTLRRDVAAIPGTVTGPRRRFGQGRGMTLLAAAVLLVGGGALAVGSGILRLPTVVPPAPEPSLIAIATASPDRTVPSPTESAAPSASPTPAPITWTEASLTQDWPSPVRTEPAGPPIVVPMLLKIELEGCPGSECSVSTAWGDPVADPTGDTGSADGRAADITHVTFCGPTCLSVGRVSIPPAGVDPRQEWVAYGVVVDDDGDGVPDVRYGVDNVLPDETDPFARTRRWWRTDLRTGRTVSAVGDDHIHLGDSGVVFWSGSGGLQFGVENVGIGEVGGMPRRFYVWASVIQDGRVVATDYAPDAGWIAPSADATPFPSPSPAS